MTTTPPLIFVQKVNENKEVHLEPSTLLCKTIKHLQNNRKKKKVQNNKIIMNKM
jgi:hypothetical protein